MADHSHQEINKLRGIVVKLANEIDYKNHLLMEKEGLSLEKFASMISSIEEKDRLLVERNEVTGSLLAQKLKLLQALAEEKRKCGLMKVEMKNRRDNELQIDLKKLEHLSAQNEDLRAQLQHLSEELNKKGEALHHLENIRKELDEKREKLQQLESLHRTFTSNERVSTIELKAARIEAIKCLQAMDCRAEVGIKKLGEIPELWNFEEGRRAPLKEVIQYIFQQWDILRNKENEHSEVIKELKAEKEILLTELAGKNVLMEEKDKLLKDKYAVFVRLMEHDKKKDTILGKSAATISTLTAEKHIVTEIRNAGKRDMQDIIYDIEKLKHDLQSHQKKLARQTLKHKDHRDRSLDCLTDKEVPTAKKLKGFKVNCINEQLSETSENKKIQGQNTLRISNHPKADPDELGEPCNGEFSRSSTLEAVIPSSLQLALVPVAVPEKRFHVKIEDQE